MNKTLLDDNAKYKNAIDSVESNKNKRTKFFYNLYLFTK